MLMGNADQPRTHVAQQVEITAQATGSGLSANAGSSNTGGSSSNANSNSTAGTSASASSNTGSSTAGSNASDQQAGAKNSFQVSGVTQVADHCGSKNSGPGPTASLNSTFEKIGRASCREG